MPATEYTTRRKITLGQDNNALTWLLIINAVIFILLNFIKVIYQLSDGSNNALIEAFHKEIFTWFVLPASGSELLYKPWTIVSFMFSQIDVLQAISNMLWLWCFGYILQDLAGNNKLIPVYIYGGLAGALAFILSCNFIPTISIHLNQIAPLVGAGCSVMAVAIATTAMTPNYRIFPLLNGGIPLWVLTLIFIIINLTTAGSAALAFSLIAAGLIGFIFIYQLKMGRDIGAWMFNFASWVNDLFNPEKKYNSPKPSDQHFYKATRKPFKKTSGFSQERLDDILDKINNEGYNMLSEDEKEFLKKASKEDL